MPGRQATPSVIDLPAQPAVRPSIVIGITNHETCLVLRGRLRSLRQAGFCVTLVSSPGELLVSTAAEENVEWHAIPMRRRISPLSDVVSLVRLWRFLRRLQPDIVEFSTPKAGLLGTLAARLCRVPRRIYLLRGLKLETTTGIKRRILLAAERLAASSAHIVLCNSGSLLDQAVALGVAPAQKLLLLGAGSSRGVDMGEYSPGFSNVRERYGLPPHANVVGFVGRLTRDKGVPELIEAFNAILFAEPNTHLLLVGWFDPSEDLLGSALRERIQNHPRIHLTGFVNSTATFYRAMDVMVLPSHREGLPNVALEAAASGVPVITTLTTGSRDSVIPEVTGLLIPPGYPEAIAEAVLKLLRDPARRHRMGMAARAWARENFVDERVLASAVVFYKNLLTSEATP